MKLSTSSDVLQVLSSKKKVRGHVILAIHLTKSLMADHIQKVQKNDESMSKIVRECAIRKSDALIIASNRKSEIDPSPNEDDVKFTQTLAEAGKMLGVCVLDHILLGKNGHYSFKKNGKVFPRGHKYVYRPCRKIYRLVCG